MGVLDVLIDSPAVLASFAFSYYGSLSAPNDMVPTSDLSLRAYQLDPSFLWAPPAARASVFSWARDAFIAQSARSSQLFADLPDDCAGDVLEFLNETITRKDSLFIATHTPTPEAQAWFDSLIKAGLAVKFGLL